MIGYKEISVKRRMRGWKERGNVHEPAFSRASILLTLSSLHPVVSMHLWLLEEGGGQSREHGGSRGEPMSTHKAHAQRTIRAVLDEGITPHGQMEEVGDYRSLMAP